LLLATAVTAADYAFVTNQNGNSLSVINLETRTEIARTDLPGAPAGVAVDATRGVFYTVSAGSKVVRKFDLTRAELQAEVTLDGGPIGIAVSLDGQRGFVSDWYNARIWMLHSEGLTAAGTLVTGSAPAGLVVARDGSWLASADRDANQISVCDLASSQLRHRIPTGLRPFGISLGPGGRLFTANVGSDSVTVADPVTGEVEATIPVGARPYAISFGAGAGFVTNQYADTVSVFDLKSLRVTATIDVGEYPEGIDATPDGKTLVVANWFSNTLSLIDAGTASVIAEIETGDGPRAFGRFIATGYAEEK
jgi:YVTN family beta-propeller protein